MKKIIVLISLLVASCATKQKEFVNDTDRLKVVYESSKYNLGTRIMIINIDGIDYIVARCPDGISIIPKVR